MSADPAFWNRIAEGYAAKPVEDIPAFERKIAVAKARLEPDSVVADLGCGTGSLALILAPHAGHVHGLDISSEMVRIARGKAADQAVSNVTFHCQPLGEALPFEPASLDMVCAMSILHLVPDLRATLRAVYEVLKPGGHLLTSTVVLRGSLVPYGLILPVMRWLGQAPKVEILAAADIEAALRDVGFVDIEALDVGAKSTVAFQVARKPARGA